MGDLLRGHNFTDGLAATAGDLHEMQDNALIKPNVVSNDKLAQVPGKTVKGNPGTGTDDPQDVAMADLAANLQLPRVDVASAASPLIGAAGSDKVNITGTVTITSFDTADDTVVRYARFDDALILTHDPVLLILPDGLDILTAAGDEAVFESLGTGNWKCARYIQANGTPLYAEDMAIVNGRLTLKSGSPIPVTDVTAATSLYFTPYRGNRILLHTIQERWATRTFGEISIALPASQFRLYDVFAYDNAGAVALELNPWDTAQVSGTVTAATAATACVLSVPSTAGVGVGDLIGMVGIAGTMGTSAKQGLNGRLHSVTALGAGSITIESPTTGLTYTSGGTWFRVPTARATALDKQDGILVKGADPTRRFLGLVMTWNVAGQSIDRLGGADTEGIRLVANYYHPVNRACYGWDSSSTWVFTGATTRARNNCISNSHYFLVLEGSIYEAKSNLTKAGLGGSGAAYLAMLGVGTILSPFANSTSGQNIGPSVGSQCSAELIYTADASGLIALRALEAALQNNPTANGGSVSPLIAKFPQ